MKAAFWSCLCLLIGCLVWVFVLYDRIGRCHGSFRSDATARALALAWMVRSVHETGLPLPDKEDDLWGYASKSDVTKLTLPTFCLGPQGRFRYEKVSTNKFTISFRAYNETVVLSEEVPNPTRENHTAGLGD